MRTDAYWAFTVPPKFTADHCAHFILFFSFLTWPLFWHCPWQFSAVSWCIKFPRELRVFQAARHPDVCVNTTMSPITLDYNLTKSKCFFFFSAAVIIEIYSLADQQEGTSIDYSESISITKRTMLCLMLERCPCFLHSHPPYFRFDPTTISNQLLRQYLNSISWHERWLT